MNAHHVRTGHVRGRDLLLVALCIMLLVMLVVLVPGTA